jgi:hypothetical protein
MPTRTTSQSWLYMVRRCTPAPGDDPGDAQAAEGERGGRRPVKAVENGAAWDGAINGAGIRIMVMGVLPTLP